MVSGSFDEALDMSKARQRTRAREVKTNADATQGIVLFVEDVIQVRTVNKRRSEKLESELQSGKRAKESDRMWSERRFAQQPEAPGIRREAIKVARYGQVTETQRR